jgi:type II secretory pathway component PulC
MAQERSVTPEKQLLKIIEEPSTDNRDIKGRKVKYTGLGLFSFRSWISRFSFLKEGIGRRFKEGEVRQLNVKALNRSLTLTIFVAVFYLISSVYTSVVNLEKPADLNFEIPEATATAGIGAAPPLKALSFYLEAIRERNIFEIARTESKVTEEVKSREPSFETLEASQSLRLVGISWSKDPDAMIEDTQSMRTYFVKRGEAVGKFKVQAIFKDRVVLVSADGEEIELR